MHWNQYDAAIQVLDISYAKKILQYRISGCKAIPALKVSPPTSMLTYQLQDCSSAIKPEELRLLDHILRNGANLTEGGECGQLESFY